MSSTVFAGGAWQGGTGCIILQLNGWTARRVELCTSLGDIAEWHRIAHFIGLED
jgi:hypothetical protein